MALGENCSSSKCVSQLLYVECVYQTERVVRYEVTVGAYNAAKSIVEFEGLEDKFAQTVCT